MAPYKGWSLYKPPKRRPPKKVLPARPRPPVRRVVKDPFAPISDEKLRAQAGSLVQDQLAPIIASIRAAIESRSQAGGQAISGYTQQLGNLWQGAPGVAKSAYDQATAAQSGINTALANRLGTFGQNLAGEVGNKLAYAGPSGQQVASNVGTAAQGTANANFAKGAAGTEMLNAQSAAAQTAAGALPGIAGLTGLQNIKQLQAQLSKELGDQLSQAQTGASSSIASIYQHLVDQELQKAIASQSGLINRDKLAVDVQYKKQSLAYKKQKDKYDRQIKLANLGISQQRVSEYARHNGITETQAANRLAQQAQTNRAKAHRPNAALSAKYGYIVDSNGRPILKNGKRQKVAKTTAPRSGGLVP
jgi:hypothetical protein